MGFLPLAGSESHGTAKDGELMGSSISRQGERGERMGYGEYRGLREPMGHGEYRERREPTGYGRRVEGREPRRRGRLGLSTNRRKGGRMEMGP
ncbi:MAG: hypothetical protein K0Q63_1409 [Paenibacillus sp.]|nr:hypothetical protein [Paenibacillus sp.]